MQPEGLEFEVVDSHGFAEAAAITSLCEKAHLIRGGCTFCVMHSLRGRSGRGMAKVTSGVTKTGSTRVNVGWIMRGFWKLHV